MAFSVQEILDKPHMAAVMREMLDLHHFLALPQFTNLWRLGRTREAALRVYIGEISPDNLNADETAKARDEARLLPRR